MERKTSNLSNGLIWFGAGVSIAEILTGTYIAPLGFAKGMVAIITGHIIGFLLMFLVGIIGGKTEKSSMETVKMSFGERGAVVFSVLNILQLIGWTAIMILSGAEAAGLVFDLGGSWIWSIIIGGLIIIWVLVGVNKLDKINYFAIGLLLILTILLSRTVFNGNGIGVQGESISFGAAVELSVAMPLSWLPLISDYTRKAKKPIWASAISCSGYFIASVWMYVIGMGATLFTGESDIAVIMTKAGLGIGALLIVILSTVTTTFLDVYSVGVSSESVSDKLRERPCAVAVTVIGALLAIFTPVTKMEGFLYLIGSVFAPMAAIQIADYFVLHEDNSDKKVSAIDFVIWIIGFALYRALMMVDMPLGYTLPAMIIVFGIRIIVGKKK